MVTLSVSKREKGSKPRTLRTGGLLPAVFYGPKEESTSIAVDMRAFEKVWQEAGESTVITLTGIGDEKEALIQDVDVDPVTGTPRHIDFYIIEKGKKVTVETPLEFIGESPAVKNLGGTLVKVQHELEVEALPKDLPHELSVDISTLTTLDSVITVKDIALPEGVVAIAPPDEVVASIAAQKEEEETTGTIDMESIEVEKKGKKEEEGADAPESTGETAE